MGYGRSILAGRQADRIGLEGRDGASIGCGDGRLSEDVNRLLGRGHGRSVLAGRQADRIGFG
jgi:hypothetical protein